MKKAVYFRYLQASSKAGFCFFVLATVLAQVVSVMSTMMLRFWGENNRETGGNAGLMDPYLLGYGFLNLASIMLAGVASLLIHVLCSLRSSKYLHDSVRFVGSWLGDVLTHHIWTDVGLDHGGTAELF